MKNVLWYGVKVVQKINKENKKIILKACLMVERDAKKSIGLVPSPSPPGHAPAAPTGRLRSSITHEVEGTTGRVGTNVEYARRVELGFVGADSLGRVYNQSPRPYLRPALHKNEKAIRQMFKKII